MNRFYLSENIPVGSHVPLCSMMITVNIYDVRWTVYIGNSNELQYRN